MTPVELRHAIVGYSDAAIRSAVVAGLLECPLPMCPPIPASPTSWCSGSRTLKAGSGSRRR